MGRYIKKCKGIAEIAVVELPEIDGGVRTVGKRTREVGDGELDLAELRRTRRRLFVESTASVSLLGSLSPPASDSEESSCGFDLSPFWLSKTSGDHVECRAAISASERNSQAETTFYASNGRGSTNLGEGMESTAGRPSTETTLRGGQIVHETPSESEIDDFFSAAEQDLHKRFSEKYNFDLVKGVPLEGRYEWAPVHHEWP